MAPDLKFVLPYQFSHLHLLKFRLGIGFQHFARTLTFTYSVYRFRGDIAMVTNRRMGTSRWFRG